MGRPYKKLRDAICQRNFLASGTVRSGISKKLSLNPLLSLLNNKSLLCYRVNTHKNLLRNELNTFN